MTEDERIRLLMRLLELEELVQRMKDELGALRLQLMKAKP